MKERPIIFNTDMVRAILEGRKTQTRRMVKPQGAILTDDMARSFGVRPPLNQNSPVIQCPYGQPGDRLWVRETFAEAIGDYAYRADYSAEILSEKRNKGLWKPSIHMPRWASRITLEIKNVNVERLHDISEDDAKKEGVELYNNYDRTFGGHSAPTDYKTGFVRLWQSIYGLESWDSNPWVWAIKFERKNV